MYEKANPLKATTSKIANIEYICKYCRRTKHQQRASMKFEIYIIEIRGHLIKRM